MPNPYEIRLTIDRVDDHYTAHWIESGGQQSRPFNLTLPLTQADASDLRWYLETYLQLPGAGDHKRAENIARQLTGWGRDMFDAVFGHGEGRDVYRNLLEAQAAGRPGLLTIGSEDAAILTQPWEMMRDERAPLVFRDVIIRRQLRGGGRAVEHRLSLPLRVLLIVSRPIDVGFIDPRNSIEPLLDALDVLPPGRVTVEFCDPPTLPQLEKTISQARKANRPFHIVHFDGHGTYLPRTGVGALAFEREDGAAHLVKGAQLGDLLARLDVPLALLEACRSSDLSDQPVFGSVAPALLKSGVGSVIAFSHAVHVQAARLLVERFYAELAGGRTIGQALAEGRAGLHANGARWLHRGPGAETIDLQDWFIPQLYQVGADLAMITPHPGPLPTGEREQTPLSQIGRARWPEVARVGGEGNLHGFPPAPLYRFHGRALELLALERAFRRYPAALLSGMGGMGKTALAREAAAWWRRTGRFEAAVFCSFEQKAGAERVVQLLGQALEGDDFSARPAEDQWATAVDLFHQRRVLLVWDNFESTLPAYQLGEAGPADPPEAGERLPSPPEEGTGGEPDSSPPAGGIEGGPASDPLTFDDEARGRLHRLYRELTAGKPLGRLLVTCRPQETGLPGLKEQPLAGLARPDSLHLLAAILDQKSISTGRPGYEREEIEALLAALDDHPLSIELVAPHLKTLTPQTIREEFDRLLARFADGSAFEGRNRSLLASLAFSSRRLSQAAQAALPYLAWFAGGAFEVCILDFTGLEPEAWAAIRAELVATALVKVEEWPQFNSPYLRFHPTLPYAARAEAVPDPAAAEQRFIAVYLSVRQAARQALRGSRPAAGMALVAGEEANLRAAIGRAFGRGDQHPAWQMAETLRDYLERAGRLRERDSLVAWVKDQLPEGAGLTAAACAAILDHAWSLFTQGQAAGAIRQVQGLLARLESEGLADGSEPAFQLALGYNYLGRIYDHAGRPDLALHPLQKALDLYEQLGEAGRGNLSAALGDLANAYSALGRFDEALAAAERGLAIARDLGNNREIAAGLGISAAILMDQQRYAEAEVRFDEALQAARAAGELELQGAILARQGGLQDDMGNQDRAVELYKQAITLVQQAHDPGGEMRTCDLLGSAERKRGHLDAAEGWYARSRELALQLNDQAQLAVTAQNLGILYQTRAEGAPDAATRAPLLRQAVAAVEESLAIELQRQNQVGAAGSYSQLGLLSLLLGAFDRAEENARQALRIRESLNLPDVYKDYGILAEIARARGDLEAAAGWQAKFEAKVAELERLRRGEGAGGPGGGPELAQLARLVLALAQAAYQARAGRAAPEPEAAEALAQLAGLPPPLGGVGAFLQAVAAGGPLPPLPPGLPPPISEILEKLVEALEE